MKKILFTILAAIIMVPVTNAQDKKVTWHLEGAAGTNIAYDKGSLGAGVSGHVGVVLFPVSGLGIRASLQAGNCSAPKKDTEWLTGKNYFKAGVTVDVMWDIINTFSKNKNRVYHIQPYIRYQNIIANGNSSTILSPAFGLGLRQTVKMNNRLQLLIDGSALAANEYRWTHKNGYVGFLQAFVGIAYVL